MQALGYVQGWQHAPARSLLLWTSGLIVIIGTFAWTMVKSHASDRARLLLSLAFAHLLYFSWLFSNPLMTTCPPPSRVPSPGYAFSAAADKGHDRHLTRPA